MTDLSPDELVRYSRHLMLPEVGSEGQARLKQGSVLVIGAGGLGSPALLYLAAAGVGRIGIIDDDAVDLSNLQRQVIHETHSVGEAKAGSAAARLAGVNPEVDVRTHTTRLTSENALEIIGDYDVIVDGTDNIPTRYLVSDACEILGKPWVYGSIYRFEGQVTLFNHDNGPNYRDLFPEPPPPEAIPSCAEAGVLGVLPAVIGGLQATEAVKLLLGIGESLSGRLLVYDALHMDFRTLKVGELPARPAVSELIDYEQFCAGPNPTPPVSDAAGQPMLTSVQEISPTDFVSQRETGWSPFLLDVRTSAEEQIVSLPGTDLRVSHLNILVEQDSLPKDRDIVVYCRTGGRSEAVASALSRVGFDSDRLFNLDGGIHAWSDQVDSAVPKY
uniref:UBA/THIF-type NAD/FAD binding protein (MOCS3, UBA4, moeB) n=1 Tax=uncultured marine group II/III euryarchaeote KM3_203_B10 TaxID=1457981 RepID=A0A075GUV8_9EURY|nr:UBA/THIF-type NAD/FAD binding protein (MOCS3, UBA4, moeB) [uncultured marine group II/III euryarchaeote KM3_203_B10]